MNEVRGKPCQCLEEQLSGHWTGNEQIQTMKQETVLDNATFREEATRDKRAGVGSGP